MSGGYSIRQDKPVTNYYESPHVDNIEINRFLKIHGGFITDNPIGISNILRNSTPVTISNASNVVYTSTQMLAGIVNRDPQGSDRTDTLPTAAEIVGGLTEPTVNTYFYVIINNTDTVNNYDITISSNTGITLQNDIVIRYSSTYLIFLLTNINSGLEAISVYSIGTNMIKSGSGVPKNTYTDNSIVRWDGITGQYIQQSTVTIDDLGVISGVATPVADSDAVTKKYVDDKILAIKWKQPVRCTTTSNVALNGVELPVNTDGITLADGDRVLVKIQTNGVENGSYLYNSSGVWQRTDDFLLGTDGSNSVFSVNEGTLNANKSYICTNDPPNDIVGTNSLVFGLFTETINPGKALTKTNGVLDVNVDNITMVVDTISNNLVCTIFPVGTVIQNVSASIVGYLLCDGSSYTRATYQDLFDILNTSKGVCTISIATPAVITLNSHGLITGQNIFITTTGALPTGISDNTTYWVNVIDVNTFGISSSYSNLVNGVYINTSGVQSGTHTLNLTIGGVTNSTSFNVPDTSGCIIGNVSSTRGVGSTTGSETHTLDITEMPSHTHTYTNPSHTHTYTDLSNTYTSNNTVQLVGSFLNSSLTFMTSLNGPTPTTTTGTTSASSAITGVGLLSSGNSQPHNIIQPTFYTYLHIKY